MSFQMPPNTILTSKAFSSAEVYNIIVLTYTIKHIFTEKEYTILLFILSSIPLYSHLLRLSAILQGWISWVCIFAYIWLVVYIVPLHLKYTVHWHLRGQKFAVFHNNICILHFVFRKVASSFSKWQNDDDGKKRVVSYCNRKIIRKRHICWFDCMFVNFITVIMVRKQQSFTSILDYLLKCNYSTKIQYK